MICEEQPSLILVSEINNIPSVAQTISEYGLKTYKSFGQHFLTDPGLCRKIARAAEPLSSRTVIEIGPGPGGLTRALLESSATQIIAIEQDKRCINALQPLIKIWPQKLRIIQGDALTVDLEKLTMDQVSIVANLPYNIGTALLLNWLNDCHIFERLTLMFQKEVAARLTAQPGSKDYGRLSIMAQWLCNVKQLFDIGPKAFVPPPKIMSTLVQLVPHAEPLFPANKKVLELLTRTVFGQRRKMLRSSIKGLVKNPEEFLIKHNVDPTLRAETLDIEQFCTLSRSLEKILPPTKI